MFKFLFKKENQVETLIHNYLDTFQTILDNFKDAFATCLNKPQCENFDFLIEQTHKHESLADDIIDEINNLMYSKALIPDSRGDIMNLLIDLDKIPEILEKILFMVRYQKIVIPKDLAMEFQDMNRISMESCELLSKQVKLFLANKTGVRAIITTIDTNESHCDHIEHRLIAQIFDSDMDSFLKLQLKNLVQKMGDISDKADRISKLVNILLLKRRF